ncbi:hypothetical protein VPH35_103420 [Triticum aestivum]
MQVKVWSYHSHALAHTIHLHIPVRHFPCNDRILVRQWPDRLRYSSYALVHDTHTLASPSVLLRSTLLLPHVRITTTGRGCCRAAGQAAVLLEHEPSLETPAPRSAPLPRAAAAPGPCGRHLLPRVAPLVAWPPARQYVAVNARGQPASAPRTCAQPSGPARPAAGSSPAGRSGLASPAAAQPSRPPPPGFPGPPPAGRPRPLAPTTLPASGSPSPPQLPA